MNQRHTKIIACATIIEEMLPLLPLGNEYQSIESGLNLHPDKLRAAL